MRKPNPTIYDVARKAGVSIATVSRVLNNPQKVNQETRFSVFNAIDTLRYVPKVEARARAMKGMGRIGVLTPFFTEPAFVQRLRGVAAALSPFNYELVIYSVDSLSRLNSYLVTLPMRGHLDGLIIISLRVDSKSIDRLLLSGLESVFIEYRHDLLSSVEINDVAGGRLVADYLFKKGHRRFAFIGDSFYPDYGVHPIHNRLVGFRQMLNDNGIELPDERVIFVPIDVEVTRQTIHRLLEMPEPPTAIFSATDLQAVGVLQAARDRGLCVPDDLAVVGFDDLDIAQYLGLTTVRHHLDESGRLAAELLFSRLSNSSRPIQHVELPLDLIERETA